MTNKKCCDKCFDYTTDYGICMNKNCECHQNKPQEVDIKELYFVGIAGEEIHIGEYVCVYNNGKIMKVRSKPQECLCELKSKKRGFGHASGCPLFINDRKPQEVAECNCKEMTCNQDCNKNHTHKTFWCDKCKPKTYKEEVANWETEFDKEFSLKVIPEDLGKEYEARIMEKMYWLPIKSFITKTIAQEKEKQKEELIKEIKISILRGRISTCCNAEVISQDFEDGNCAIWCGECGKRCGFSKIKQN